MLACQRPSGETHMETFPNMLSGSKPPLRRRVPVWAPVVLTALVVLVGGPELRADDAKRTADEIAKLRRQLEEARKEVAAARKEAEEQRRRADAARQEAQIQRDRAEASRRQALEAL